jgi:hypothetical protein
MFAAEEAARMPRRIKKPVPRKIVLRLPDLDHLKSSVLDGTSTTCVCGAATTEEA